MKIIPPYLSYEYFRGVGEWDSLLCDLATLSYASEDFIRLKLLDSPFELKDIIRHGDFQCIVAKGRGRLVITFKGTDSLYDWYTDIKVGLTPHGIHEGFFGAAKQFFDQLARWAAGEDVTLGGHSLGGAMTTVECDDLSSQRQELSIKSIELVTFGSPRVGDHSFAERVHRRVHEIRRYVHGEDEVPQVPFNAMHYEHVGREIHLRQMPRPWLHAIPWPNPYYCPMRIFSHVPTNYCARLWGE
jgi:hypothetical protein